LRILNLFIKYTFRLGPINFFDYLFQRFIKKNNLLNIKVPGLPDKIYLRNYTSDIPLFANIFMLREYDVSLDGEVKTIIDCGANIGLASLFFLSKFKDCRIIAIEPEINNFRLLNNNLKNYDNVTCINKGVWNVSTYLEITNPDSGNHAFIVKETASRSGKAIKAISIEDIIKDFQLSAIDILKIDIEGSEEQVFLSNPEWIKKVRMIFCEIHENLKPGLTNSIKSLLASDFDFFMHGEYHVFKRKSDIL
jgi:FkbM family methyltransferase